MKEEKSCIVEVWSRITGFFRPHIGWNKGKMEELSDRKHYKIGGKDEQGTVNEDNRLNG